jgi:hypothetical protein
MSTPPDNALNAPWRPGLDDVASLIRARTKDASGNETGTWSSATRPTDAEVEACISHGCSKVATLVGWDFDSSCYDEATHLAALWAACEIEQSYWPEQVRTERSPFAQLMGMFTSSVQAFIEFVATMTPIGGIAPRAGTLYVASATTNFAYQYGFGTAGVPMNDIVNVG